MPPPVVALALPGRGRSGADQEAYTRGVAAKATAGGLAVAPAQCWASLLPYTFNTLWAGHLNLRTETGAVYFAMIHDDVVPPAGWLDRLVAVLAETGADLVSAVVPIKDTRGLTSTAVEDGDEWQPKRLTLHEVFRLPAVFGDRDAGGDLLLNTGLWCCRFDRPWCERVFFRQQDRITRRPDGAFAAETIPEDWDFSRQVRRQGGTLLAARLELEHERPEWHTRFPWGKWKTDQDATRPPAAG